MLAVLSAALLWVGWPRASGAAGRLLLVALGAVSAAGAAAHAARRQRRKVFRYTYLFLVLWNAFTTWWVSYSTLGGGIAAVVLNALLMCLPTMAFQHTKQLAGPTLGYLSLPIFWIAFEQLHLHWDLTWPWLTLGNGFAQANDWVQWYEYTGFLGGSVWVWAVNILVFKALFGFKFNAARKAAPAAGVAFRPGEALPNRAATRWLVPVLAAVLPIVLSYTYQG